MWSWRQKKSTYLSNLQDESFIFLVVDPVLDQDLVHHRDEDHELAAQLEDHGGEGLHGRTSELRCGVQGSHQGVYDPRSKISEVQCVTELVNGF